LKLGQAYDTLKDVRKRREYDFIYPSIVRRRSSPQSTQTPGPPPQELSEAVQIATLQRSKQDRSTRWRIKKNAFDVSVFELQKGIWQLEQEIKNLNSILAAEAATEAQKNSWGTWLLSPIYTKVEDSEEEKARKDRGRQERRIEKDMKERRLELRKADMKKEQNLLNKAKDEVEAADLGDDRKIGEIQAKIRLREFRERQEREKVEKERMAKIWRQEQEEREQRDREAAQTRRKLQEERRAAEQKRQEEATKYWEKVINGQYAHLNQSDGRSTRQAHTSTCRHDGWWAKVQGRTACPECNDIWTYLLQCPSCAMKACPKCQSAIRPRITRNTARTFQRNPPRVRTPSPALYDDYW
jgi:hypothetical protein